MKIKSLIIDDNSFVIDLLSDQLRQYHPDVEVLGIAKSGADGLKKIKLLKPDLIFLDIEMDDMTGFDLLSQLDDITFQTIFITSHSHYAIKAIRFNALDYLLKPINEKELSQAIKRHTSSTSFQANKTQVKQALVNLKTKTVEDQSFLLQTQKGTLRLFLRNIVKIEGERNYSNIHLSNNKRVLSSKTLGYFEEILSEKGFFRCHRSFLINRYHIDHLGKSNFILKDQTQVLVSRRKKSEAKRWFMSDNLVTINESHDMK